MSHSPYTKTIFFKAPIRAFCIELLEVNQDNKDLVVPTRLLFELWKVWVTFRNLNIELSLHQFNFLLKNIQYLSETQLFNPKLSRINNNRIPVLKGVSLRKVPLIAPTLNGSVPARFVFPDFASLDPTIRLDFDHVVEYNRKAKIKKQSLEKKYPFLYKTRTVDMLSGVSEEQPLIDNTPT